MDCAADFDVFTSVGDGRRRQRAERSWDLPAQLAERDATIREMDHRIKNHLQLLASLTRNLARQPGETKEHIAAEIAAQLDAVAAVHDALHRAQDHGSIVAGPFLTAVCAPFRGLEPQLTLECPAALRLPASQLAPLGMFVTEALNNAFKHAAARRVTVTLQPAGDGLCLTVADDGIGMPSITCSGSGFNLLKTFARSLRGQMTVGDGQPGGTRIELRFGQSPARAL